MSFVLSAKNRITCMLIPDTCANSARVIILLLLESSYSFCRARAAMVVLWSGLPTALHCTAMDGTAMECPAAQIGLRASGLVNGLGGTREAKTILHSLLKGFLPFYDISIPFL